MGRNILAAFSGVMLAVNSGCAIHPLPDDVTKKSTFDIVNKIRCEMRSELYRKAYKVFTDQRLKDQGWLDSYTLSIARQLGGEYPDISQFEKEIKNKDILNILQYYTASAIVYNFRFDIKINNNIGATSTIGRAVTSTVLGVDLSAGSDMMRENERNFIMTETFHDIMTDSYLHGHCANLNLKTTNYIYPITGNIGLGEMVDTFIDLNQTKVLSSKDGQVPNLSDKMTFQTKLSGGINPKLEITRPMGNVGASAAAIDLKADRTDIHELTVVLSLGPKPRSPGAKKTKSGRTQSEENGLRELNRIQTFIPFDVPEIRRKLEEMQ